MGNATSLEDIDIYKLPEDILVLVLAALPENCLATFARCCKFLYTLISERVWFEKCISFLELSRRTRILHNVEMLEAEKSNEQTWKQALLAEHIIHTIKDKPWVYYSNSERHLSSVIEPPTTENMNHYASLLQFKANESPHAKLQTGTFIQTICHKNRAKISQGTFRVVFNKPPIIPKRFRTFSLALLHTVTLEFTVDKQESFQIESSLDAIPDQLDGGFNVRTSQLIWAREAEENDDWTILKFDHKGFILRQIFLSLAFVYEMNYGFWRAVEQQFRLYDRSTLWRSFNHAPDTLSLYVCPENVDVVRYWHEKTAKFAGRVEVEQDFESLNNVIASWDPNYKIEFCTIV